MKSLELILEETEEGGGVDRCGGCVGVVVDVGGGGAGFGDLGEEGEEGGHVDAAAATGLGELDVMLDWWREA